MFATLNAMYASLHSQCEPLKVYVSLYLINMHQRIRRIKIALGFMVIRQLKSTA